jgi:hypothetical protein
VKANDWGERGLFAIDCKNTFVEVVRDGLGSQVGGCRSSDVSILARGTAGAGAMRVELAGRSGGRGRDRLMKGFRSWGSRGGYRHEVFGLNVALDA